MKSSESIPEKPIFKRGRLPTNDQEIYDIKVAKLLGRYIQLRKQPQKINSEKLIEEFHVTRHEKLINYKQLCNILSTKLITSQKEWRNNITQKFFIHLRKQGIERSKIVDIIACRLQMDRAQINQRLSKLGFGINQLDAATEESIILDFNSKINSNIILKKYNINFNIMKLLASKYNFTIPCCWYAKNSKFNYIDLSDISNPLQAHLLGLVWADGSISSGKQVIIALCVDDMPYLEEVQKNIIADNNYPVLHVADRSKDKGRLGKESKDTVSLAISRKDYLTFVRRQGLTKNKEKKKVSLPKFLQKRHTETTFLAWLRGFYEGDGFISTYVNSKTKSKTPVLGFSIDNEYFCQQIQDILLLKFNIKSSYVKDKSIFSLRVSGVSPVFFLLCKIYSVAQEVIMARKLNRCKEIWKSDAPEYLTSIMPEFSIEYINRKEIFTKILEKFKLNFNQGVEAISLIHIETKKTFEGTIESFNQQTGIDPMRILSGNRTTVEGWIVSEEYKDSERYKNKTIRSKRSSNEDIYLVNDNNEVFSGKRHDFICEYNISSEGLNRVLNGVRPTCNGWSINFKRVNKSDFIKKRNTHMDKYLSKPNKIIKLVHSDGTVFEGKKIDFLKEHHDFFQDDLNRILSGARPSMRNWRLDMSDLHFDNTVL